METIYLIVRNIIFVVLLAVFLEMLLPLKETRRFLEVVVGLFVVLSILNPLVSWLHDEEPEQAYLQMEKQEGELEGILEQGKELQQVQSEQVSAAYGEQLEQQICAAAQMVSGVSGASADLVFSTDTQDNQLILERVHLVIEKEEKDVAPVQEVKIGSKPVEPGQDDETGDQEVVEQVRNTIVALFGLQPEQVVVTWKE
ncbi:MAG TPA: stage III sporulation protein AF [Syntrophomonadaceae bacterium]|nr:stage III sporulation protein AF [Syntrophomonadaceae bacterium]